MLNLHTFNTYPSLNKKMMIRLKRLPIKIIFNVWRYNIYIQQLLTCIHLRADCKMILLLFINNNNVYLCIWLYMYIDSNSSSRENLVSCLIYTKKHKKINWKNTLEKRDAFVLFKFLFMMLLLILNVCKYNI